MAKDKIYKLDLWKTLSAIANRKFDFYKSLTDDEKKGFVPLVVMRYISSVSAGKTATIHYLTKVNELVNKHMWSITTKHNDLQFKLLAACGLGETARFEWIGKKTKDDKLFTYLQEIYPNEKTDDVKCLLEINGREWVIELATSRGEDKEIIKKLKSNV